MKVGQKLRMSFGEDQLPVVVSFFESSLGDAVKTPSI